MEESLMVKLGSLIAALLLFTACGGGGGAGTDTSAGAGGSGDDMTLTIDSPADGNEVSVPFTIQLTSSVPLGAPETGDHHVHIYFDDNEDDYAVVEGDSYEVTELPPGEHEIYASLRNADHSDTGVETEVEVEVSGKGGGGSMKDEKDDDYDY
jgi:hypothetical protein